MFSQLKSVALPALCIGSLIGMSGASAQNAPEKYRVLTVEVKPGMDAQFEEFIHKFRDAVEKNKGPQHWLASSSMSGNAVYFFTVPFATWAGEFGQNAPNPLIAAYGEQEAAKVLGLLAASTESETTAIYAARPDLSRPRPQATSGQAATPVAVEYVDLNVKIGKEQEFEGYVKKLIEATNKAEPTAYWQMRQRAFGPGNTPSYRAVVQFLTWADLDKQGKSLQQRLTEAFGAAEGEKIQGLASDALQGVNQRLARVRIDLERPPAN
jgi:hypothetical protein